MIIVLLIYSHTSISSVKKFPDDERPAGRSSSPMMFLLLLRSFFTSAIVLLLRFERRFFAIRCRAKDALVHLRVSKSRVDKNLRVITPRCEFTLSSIKGTPTIIERHLTFLC